MSSIDFAPIQHERPDLSQAASEVGDWLGHHENLKRLSLQLLSRELSDRVGLIQLARLLHELEQRRLVAVKYAVLTPSGEVSQDEFDSLDEIPEVLLDWFDKPFQVDESRIIPIYRLE